MEVKDKEKIAAELEKIVGAEHVSTAQADLYSYSRDMTQNKPSWPDFVVMPDGVEEVQGVMRLANREKIPVIPYTAGASIGGLTIPLKGGIILDLGRMNRLIEFNEPDRYMIVEPAFTFGDLRRLLDKEYPHLHYGFCMAPPASSCMSNALLIGFGYNSNSLGTNADNVNGMEVVLPTGEVVKIGSCAVSPYWSNRGPLPDLAGLFLGWQGATGVVTKIALQVWPRHPFSQTRLLFTTGIRPTCTLLRRVSQTQICEQAVAFASELEGEWPPDPARWAASETGGGGQTAATFDRPPGPDTFSVLLRVEVDSEDELKAKNALLDVFIKEELKGTEFIELPAQWTDMAQFPTRGTSEHLGGLTWIGTMGPVSQWIKAMEKVLPLFDKYRLRRVAGICGFRGGHYGMLRPIVAYNNSDPDEVERVEKFMQEILQVVLDCGFVPYKAHVWAVEEMMRRGDPNWVELLTRVKKMLDPNNIMNPGRYGDTRG